jgi:hypothetical protein
MRVACFENNNTKKINLLLKVFYRHTSRFRFSLHYSVVHASLEYRDLAL